jgi:dihydroxyacetone kinase
LVVERVYCGTFLSSLEMAGVSLSVLRIDEARLRLLDAPTDAPAWPNPGATARPRRQTNAVFQEVAEPTGDFPVVGLPRTLLGQGFEKALMAATQALSAASARLTEMDRAVGDADLGISLTRGARALREGLEGFPLDDPAAALHAAGVTLQAALGGTSGPLYAVFFLRASSHLKATSASDPRAWADSFHAACAGVMELGGAGQGDRTMLDALLPAADAFSAALDEQRAWPEALAAAADASELGAKETATMTPRRGRSSYLGVRAIGHPDPGAEAVAVWLRALARAFREGR